MSRLSGECKFIGIGRPEFTCCGFYYRQFDVVDSRFITSVVWVDHIHETAHVT